MPLREFSWALLVDLRMPRTTRTLWYLLRINVIFHVMYCRYRYPRYGHLAQRLGIVLERMATGLLRLLHGGRPGGRQAPPTSAAAARKHL